VPSPALTTAIQTSKPEPEPDLVAITEFAKIQLKIAEILTAVPVEGAKKLLKLTIDVGEAAPRQLVAGIAESYTPDQLPGKKIVVVANLQPATIRGVQSQGMLLAATDANGKAILLTPENQSIAPGSGVR
jgi:methionyl-tRNA synthetase